MKDATKLDKSSSISPALSLFMILDILEVAQVTPKYKTCTMACSNLQLGTRKEVKLSLNYYHQTFYSIWSSIEIEQVTLLTQCYDQQFTELTP
uniref:Uncharacterized protein n=1 Tax=Romanomermis culicivorax TaxID=13658 RepID=A0A915KXI2_ROMCU